MAPAGPYGRCRSCLGLFIRIDEGLRRYPFDESARPTVEQALGFPPAAASGPPERCPNCRGALEVLPKDGEFITRCDRCGLLCRMQPGQRLVPIVVQPPEGGWNPELQAIFEERLGFPRRLRRHPPGIIEI